VEKNAVMSAKELESLSPKEWDDLWNAAKIALESKSEC
jgi:trehalose/maltose hydrolase-like predicted phosphorylase